MNKVIYKHHTFKLYSSNNIIISSTQFSCQSCLVLDQLHRRTRRAVVRTDALTSPAYKCTVYTTHSTYQVDDCFELYALHSDHTAGHHVLCGRFLVNNHFMHNTATYNSH